MQWARRRSGGSFSFFPLFFVWEQNGQINRYLLVHSGLLTLSRQPLVLPEAERWPRVRPGVTTRPPAQTHASQPAKWISIRGAVAHSRRLLDTACGHRCRDFPPPRYDDDDDDNNTQKQKVSCPQWGWIVSGNWLLLVKHWYCTRVVHLTIFCFVLSALKTGNYVSCVFKSVTVNDAHSVWSCELLLWLCCRIVQYETASYFRESLFSMFSMQRKRNVWKITFIIVNCTADWSELLLITVQFDCSWKKKKNLY